ncbi:hypothetical protein QFC21_004389 [Naganishia friedmannii]|uniref:Uncharacterized protein n=1 Tax=Naganishia friedmannii TaxID=89922 RepID=A0ACC2VJF7_9TREE|nr:hypothetical protein QFC21_004389 [Naganishia friedmannii]
MLRPPLKALLLLLTACAATIPVPAASHRHPPPRTIDDDSPPCKAYTAALDLLHTLEPQHQRDGQEQGTGMGTDGVNIVVGRRRGRGSGGEVGVKEVWKSIWGWDDGGEGVHGGESTPTTTTARAKTLLQKLYLLSLVLLHKPLYGFLGIDIVSSLTTASSPIPLLGLGGRSGTYGDARRLVELLKEATEGGDAACADAWTVRGLVALLPPAGVEPDLEVAFKSFRVRTRSHRLMSGTHDAASHREATGHTANATAQFMQGFMHAAGLRGVEQDQSKAYLEYTFAALQGLPEAEMVLGYRYWSGIGVREDCMASLDWYQNAAEKSYKHFLAGPPGGRTLPLNPTKLSDLAGGLYGFGASWASTGMNVARAGIKAGKAVNGGETFDDIIEYYRFQSEREAHKSTVALGRIYYFGSLYPQSGGLVSGAEAVGAVPQSFTTANAYFLKAARAMWSTDPKLHGGALPVGFDHNFGQRQMSEEAYDALAQSAATAAGMLGRMYLRGEGGPQNLVLAHMWLKRGSGIGDREARNLLGIAYRDGLGVERRPAQALHFFSAAAGADLPDAHIQLGKMHASETDIAKQDQAVQSWSQALALGNNFEAYYHLGRIHASDARTQSTGSQKKSGTCGVAVAYFKSVAERGSWRYPYMRDAERAWAQGERAKALINWWIAAEMGYETAQNNVAFILDQERNLGQRRKSITLGMTEALNIAENTSLSALTHWIRSAGQSNVDALVKVGDYYYDRIGLKSNEDPYEKAISAYQSAADTQASAMAFWNLGWMYENGLGVPQDWHLAKRFYDLCRQTNSEAYFPVTLSLLKLHLRSWLSSFLGGSKQEHLDWFAPMQDMQDLTSTDALDPLEAKRDLAQEEDMDVVAWARSQAREEMDDTYDDYLETGRVRRSTRRSGEQETTGEQYYDSDDNWDAMDELRDTAMVGLLVAGLTAAFWIRARQVRQRQEREEAEARARGEVVPPRPIDAAEGVARPGLDFPPVPF